MYRCELCNIILEKRNKTERSQSKKHKHFSKLILNRCVIKNDEVIKFKDVFNPYFTAHTRRFNLFTASIFLKLYDGEHPLDHEINVSNYVTYNIRSEH